MKTSLLLLQLCALAFFLQSCGTDTAGPTGRGKTMILSSSGEISTLPDEASITLHLQCMDKDIKQSKQCLLEKSEALNNLFKSYKIAPEDILTTSINQSKEYGWQNNSNVFLGFRSSITVSLKVRRLAVLEELYPALLTNENVTIGNLAYSHSKLDSLSQEAYQKALTNANTLADKLVKKMGLSGKEILRIANVELPTVQEVHAASVVRPESGMATDAAANSRITLNYGSVYLSKTLHVEYKLD
ncbi:hypothetical protein TH61_10100 [Rufibacter sp. DG15C]|uniref:SIMPL domain-containing protein n=1 Tax=Rufibacter sp. DG15C TaxID=1379909 RepID=UPI00078CC8CE|nr:SIMPL domain-containing protein [Rufibacter sp. DG15C]AMM51455.1 hypothetical protein TH61_10100 [Rufibacter sp. DG15C]